MNKRQKKKGTMKMQSKEKQPGNVQEFPKSQKFEPLPSNERHKIDTKEAHRIAKNLANNNMDLAQVGVVLYKMGYASLRTGLPLQHSGVHALINNPSWVQKEKKVAHTEVEGAEFRDMVRAILNSNIPDGMQKKILNKLSN